MKFAGSAQPRHAGDGALDVLYAAMYVEPYDYPREVPGELAEIFRKYQGPMMVLPYSTVGLKAGVDFMLWRIGYEIEPFQKMAVDLNRSVLGRYLEVPASYLAMTKHSQYVDEHVHEGLQRIRVREGQRPAGEDERVAPRHAVFREGGDAAELELRAIRPLLRTINAIVWWAVVGAMFVLATGLCFLETAADTYVNVLGPQEGAPKRLNLAQG